MLSSTLRFFALAAIASVALLSHDVEARASRGLAWGTDNRWAKNIAKGSVDWYHHWQDGPVDQMPNGVEYVPMLWGQKKIGLWNQRKKHFHKHKPKYVLSINEPDVASQGNMSPQEAVNLHMRELEPLRKKGIKVSSPQIVYNTKWMDSFLKKLHARGGDIDFIAAHYYGSWKDANRLKKWIKTLRKKYHKNIWLTEYGVTASSGGSASQIRNFQSSVTKWLDSKSYVDRVAWLGCFAVSNPPDSYASRQNAMLSSNGHMRSIGYSFVYPGKNGKRDESSNGSPALEARATPGAKRHAMQHHRRIIGLQQAADVVRRNGTEAPATINGYPATTEEIEEFLRASAEEADDDDDEEEDSQVEAAECDEICQERDAQTADVDLDDDTPDN